MKQVCMPSAPNSKTHNISLALFTFYTQSETSSIRLPFSLSLRVNRAILILSYSLCYCFWICHHRPHNHPTEQHRGTSTGSPELSSESLPPT
ncbi:hypothetical protein VP01_459g4 [Puccinia sorghi]|uniref:Uncharacterized protein n=1 Tax=Puccinia sorghi TaxID=27349 RepID=A0A0L6UNJ4_9BASI|nr:hypothetical protein VP01_459g4 [Puccinia sorghi]